MKQFFSAASWNQDQGVGIIRMLIGVSLIYHGCELFDTPVMNEYLTWDLFKDAFGKFMVYGGKLAELLAGVLLLLGLLTRIACIIIVGTMAYIAFVVGNGKIWYQDQYPFLYVIIAVIFLFTGPGSFSFDRLLFKSKSSTYAGQHPR